jgi:hypothetical protein
VKLFSYGIRETNFASTYWTGRGTQLSEGILSTNGV